MITLPFKANGSNGDIPDNGSLMLDLRSVQKYYASPAGDYHALKGIDLQVNHGEFVSIIGRSGSGKSTLLNMISGIDRPTTGEVWVNGTALHAMDEDQMARWRGGNLGILFQFFQLLPALSLLQNVILPMDLAGKYSRRERRARAEHLLEIVGLTDHKDKLPGMVSGGQQQRAALARALANDPPLVVADEPTGNLDSRTAETVFALFNELVAQGKTVIIVTHDSSLAKRAHRTALIADGEIVNEYVAKALPTLTPDQLLRATHKVEPRQYAAGAVILAEGRNSSAFYIVSKGAVEVILPRPNQSDVVALELGPGKYFGEMEFFHDRRNRASIRACESCPAEVLAMDYENLSALLHESDITRQTLERAANLHETENSARRAGNS
ncbi:MAG TPA: ATP-binding cassette domain-containing protein [Anaerolineales bacterium]|nr:ATP-binding cassette domain-containing protein [Anaerolineales bacterium]